MTTRLPSIFRPHRFHVRRGTANIRVIGESMFRHRMRLQCQGSMLVVASHAASAQQGADAAGKGVDEIVAMAHHERMQWVA